LSSTCSTTASKILQIHNGRGQSQIVAAQAVSHIGLPH
jgi:hypothetical protein